MKHKIIIEGTMTFSFSYISDCETTVEALDEAFRKAATMNKGNIPVNISNTYNHPPTIVYHVKKVSEENPNE